MASKFGVCFFFNLSFNGAGVGLLVAAGKMKRNERNPNNVNQI